MSISFKINFLSTPENILSDHILKTYSSLWSYDKLSVKKVFGLTHLFSNRLKEALKDKVRNIIAKDGHISFDLDSTFLDEVKDQLAQFNWEHGLLGYLQERK